MFSSDWGHYVVVLQGYRKDSHRYHNYHHNHYGKPVLLSERVYTFIDCICLVLLQKKIKNYKTEK